MIRILAVSLLSLVATTGFGQMMGGSISTRSYFLLVDGAQYDYMYTRGPWATSHVEMHAGQIWAGVSGLTAMHSTYVCRLGAVCAPDATDFYRMDPDGMRYFGGTGANATGTQYSMMTLTNPEWLLKNPISTGTMMGGGGYQHMDAWQAGIMGSGNMMGDQSYMSQYWADALETVSTPAGTFANALHVHEQRGSGYARDVWYAPGVGIVKIDDGTNTAVLTGYTIPGALAQPGGGAAPLAFTPVSGMWWNPSESGSGYNIQVQRGVLVATVFTYTHDGEPVWYLVVGPLVNAPGGVAASSTLDRYRGGQCVACAYRMPAMMGNDGQVTITFSSPAAGVMSLPGGRIIPIEPMAW